MDDQLSARFQICHTQSELLGSCPIKYSVVGLLPGDSEPPSRLGIAIRKALFPKRD